MSPGGAGLGASGEVLGPPGTAGALGHTDAEPGQVAVEDVRPVAGAVHPRVHDGGRVRLAVGDVLRVGDQAGPGGAVERVEAVGVDVVEEAAVPHVGAVRAGDGGQRRVGGQCATAGGRPLD